MFPAGWWHRCCPPPLLQNHSPRSASDCLVSICVSATWQECLAFVASIAKPSKIDGPLAKMAPPSIMTRARNEQVSLADTPYYHCISRCVRRAYLCGDDPVTGKNFDHRKRWLVMRIKQLAAEFAIDVCAYAVMSNHYHLVLHVDQQQARQWTDEEVIRHWTALFPANGRLIKTLQENLGSRAAAQRHRATVALWRERLQDISWFMRCLNEGIARKANREDECTGRFWEGRFKSQALLDDKALLTCMAYVDLNPVRAGLTDSLEQSDFTSIQERLLLHARRVKSPSQRQKRLLNRRNAAHLQPGILTVQRQKPLRSLNQLSGFRAESPEVLPITQTDYLTLLEETCKALTAPEQHPEHSRLHLRSSAEQLTSWGISPLAWLQGVTAFHKHYGQAAGNVESLQAYQYSRIQAGSEFRHRKKWIRGLPAARKLFAA